MYRKRSSQTNPFSVNRDNRLVQVALVGNIQEVLATLLIPEELSARRT
jgi:hypothetical protein